MPPVLLIPPVVEVPPVLVVVPPVPTLVPPVDVVVPPVDVVPPVVAPVPPVLGLPSEDGEHEGVAAANEARTAKAEVYRREEFMLVIL
jgi:hypothetical protein